MWSLTLTGWIPAWWASTLATRPRIMPSSPTSSQDTLAERRAKLFLVNREDQASLSALQQLYPDGAVQLYPSFDEGHGFWIFFVPPEP